MEIRTVHRRFVMADITPKEEILRTAVAVGELKLRPETISRIKTGKVEKGDPLAAAEVAAVLAAKNTSQMLPFCHPIPLTNVQVRAEMTGNSILVETEVKSTARTGVEMEALSASAVYLLTVWDMVKPYEKDEAGQYPYTAISHLGVKSKIKGKAP